MGRHTNMPCLYGNCYQQEQKYMTYFYHKNFSNFVLNNLSNWEKKQRLSNILIGLRNNIYRVLSLFYVQNYLVVLLQINNGFQKSIVGFRKSQEGKKQSILIFHGRFYVLKCQMNTLREEGSSVPH